MRRSDELSTVLVIDSGSPVVSVAFGSPTQLLASRSMAIAHSSEALLRSIDETLVEAGARVRDIDGLVGLRGPGSFTGLRVGLATLLGLHQALGVPATALPTLEVLSRAVGPGPQPVAAVVDALRGECFMQLFADGRALGPAEIVPVPDVATSGAKRAVGHNLEVLRPLLPTDFHLVEARELAPIALQTLGHDDSSWSPARLIEPLYLRPPAIQGRG